MRPKLSTALLLLAGSGVILGCRGAPSEAEPIVPIRNMYQQPRYNTQARSNFFADGRTMRPLVAGTVAREMEPDLTIETGWSEEDQTWVLTIPRSVIDGHGDMQGLLTRGQDRFGIYCTPCHGQSGAGDGMVPTRAGGPIKPPTFHADNLRHIPDGQLFATISYGVRNMPAYEHAIPTRDRWAIVGYVRALQLSQAQQPQANLVLPQAEEGAR